MRFAYSALSVAIFSILTTAVYAEPDSQNKAVNLSAIVLQAEDDSAKNSLGKTVYSKADLEKIPNSSKNITDFLKVNPNIQFDSRARSALQQGELSPSDISINGGLGYDNKFLINGMSTNNNINPVGASTSNDPNDLLGTSQTVAVNTDLLCKITVLDSNVSAEYGEFTGGVVSAETCKPNTAVGEIHGQINYDYTSDSWSKIQFPNPEDLEGFEDSTSEKSQPFFTKQGVSANIYGNVSDSLGFNAFGSYRHSAIPLKTTIQDPTRFEQERESSNAGLELFYQPSDQTRLKVGAQFFENQGQYFVANVKDSESTHSSDSQSFYINLAQDFSKLTLEQQLNYQTQAAQRSALPYTYVWNSSVDKNWSNDGSAREGHLGNLEQEERRLEYAVKAKLQPLEFAASTHQIKVGAGFGHYEADWQRPQDVYSYSTPLALKTGDCLGLTGHAAACDTSAGSKTNFGDGQYLSLRTIYAAGQVDVQQDRWHAFIEDQISWNEYLKLQLGLRSDYDSLTKNLNIAPRTSLSYLPLGDQRLSFSTGWNRYYGMNAFANELQDRLDQLQNRQKRASLAAGWSDDPAYTGATATYRSQLDTPFSDEIVFAMNSQVRNMNIGLKWVNRDNQDQLRQTKIEKRPEVTGTQQFSRSYDNSGRSESDIYTLSLSNINPLQFKNTRHQLSLAADYTDTIRNFESYNSVAYYGTPIVIYDGKKTDAEFIPASTFNTPWTVRGTWNIAFDRIPLQISNFLSYQGKTDAMKRKANGYTDEDGIKYDTYTPYETKAKFAWDMRTTYDILNHERYKTILGLTINNVTNHRNMYIDSSGVAKPEIGRQFIADVTFKF